VQVDNAKTKASSKLRVQPKKKYTNETASEIEEDEEDEDDFTPESEANSEEDAESYSSSEASASEDDSQEIPDDVTPAKAMKAKKVKAVEKRRKKPTKRRADGKKKKESSRKKRDEEEESKPSTTPIPSSAQTKETEGNKDEEEKKGGNRESIFFSDGNIDLDLYHSSPANVVQRKARIAQNLIVTCRHVDQYETAKRSGMVGYNYPALTFVRKTGKDKKDFEFSVNLSYAPAIIEAIEFLIKENPKFFGPIYMGANKTLPMHSPQTN